MATKKQINQQMSALILAAGLCSFTPAADAANISKTNNLDDLNHELEEKYFARRIGCGHLGCQRRNGGQLQQRARRQSNLRRLYHHQSRHGHGHELQLSINPANPTVFIRLTYP